MLMVLMALVRSSSITCCSLSYKIRFEAPKRQWEIEKIAKVVPAKLIYNNICVVPDMIITIYYN